ncbi:MAG: glycosyl transferase [Paracoccus denitrificans]|nr:MAG: glycosyl transferase [Paracoccus denitrificans]PZO84199.1 MAG: glycosyl transferase [Paracoccus denitrificans]
MARIAFILLCHKDPKGVIAQARRLTESGDYVSIHFDARARQADFMAIQAALKGNAGVTFAARRIKCGWGEWSLVAATLEAVRAAITAFPKATHFYMLSGDCMPIKSAAYAHDFLDRNDADFIENFDFFESDWIRTGFKDERLIYRHPFNERTQKSLFYLNYEVQKRLGLTRNIPRGIQVRIGSQWWCLRRDTIEKLLAFCGERPDILRFFRTTWIPDETFFQTLVPHLVARREIRSRTLTFLMFTDYGMPVTFYNDHYDLLLGQDFLFARKVSAEALELRQRLGVLWRNDEAHFAISNEAAGLFRFLTQRGREGRRYKPRFWEVDGRVGRSRTLLIILCKKWHVAKRLTQHIREITAIPAVDYLFNETDAGLPDMGGVEKTVGKRERHRRALVRLLFEQLGTERLALCLDTSALGLVQDFVDDDARIRLLLIESDFTDEYVAGHIGRVGLAGANTALKDMRRLIDAVRSDLEDESNLIREIGGVEQRVISPGRSVEENAAALGEFLRIDASRARALAETPHLFDD